jgi:hypothetical protein
MMSEPSITPPVTFIVDCHRCKAKVAAVEKGRAQRQWWEDGPEEPRGERVLLGTCPVCKAILVGESVQLDFEGYDAPEDRWSDVVRVYPKPPKIFTSYRIPRTVTESLREADRCMQASAPSAACVMLGRALEALCRDVLEPDAAGDDGSKPTGHRGLMLGPGIRQLRDKEYIDDRLYDWSQQLQAFRNLAAHPDEITIDREDAEDLQSFVYAIVEYVYDLADRYDEFKSRVEERARRMSR